MKADILSMGTMYVDINAKHFPLQDSLKINTEVIGNEYEVAPGGSALNFARFCASLDLKPVFVGKVGNDLMGNVLLQLVTKSGVIPAFIQSDEVATNIGMNFLGENGNSIMTVVGSANHSLKGEEVMKKVEEYGDQVSFIYLGGCFKLKALMPFYNHIAIRAKEQKSKVVLDHGRVTNAVSEDNKEIIRKLLPHVEYYLPSKEEFLDLWGMQTVEEGLKKVREVFSGVIIIKDAENGAIGYEGTNLVHVPGFKVNVINSVGAGDCFNAAFIKAHILQMNLKDCLRFACATAALKISQNDLPTIEAVKILLNN
jgi:ribokinase